MGHPIILCHRVGLLSFWKTLSFKNLCMFLRSSTEWEGVMVYNSKQIGQQIFGIGFVGFVGWLAQVNVIFVRFIIIKFEIFNNKKFIRRKFTRIDGKHPIYMLFTSCILGEFIGFIRFHGFSKLLGLDHITILYN